MTIYSIPKRVGRHLGRFIDGLTIPFTVAAATVYPAGFVEKNKLKRQVEQALERVLEKERAALELERALEKERPALELKQAQEKERAALELERALEKQRAALELEVAQELAQERARNNEK